jgi:hypothetical protein
MKVNSNMKITFRGTDEEVDIAITPDDPLFSLIESRCRSLGIVEIFATFLQIKITVTGLSKLGTISNSDFPLAIIKLPFEGKNDGNFTHQFTKEHRKESDEQTTDNK